MILILRELLAFGYILLHFHDSNPKHRLTERMLIHDNRAIFCIPRTVISFLLYHFRTGQFGDGRLCKNSLYIASKYDIIALDKLCESWDAK